MILPSCIRSEIPGALSEYEPHVVDNISKQNDLVEEFYSKMASQGNFDNVQRKPSGRTKEQRPEDDEKKPKTTKISESARYERLLRLYCTRT